MRETRAKASRRSRRGARAPTAAPALTLERVVTLLVEAELSGGDPSPPELVDRLHRMRAAVPHADATRQAAQVLESALRLLDGAHDREDPPGRAS